MPKTSLTKALAKTTWTAVSSLRGACLSVAVASAMILTGCQHQAPEEVATETVVPVTAEAAQIGEVRDVIHATGLVTPAPGAEQIVTPPETARIAEMPKGPGERVRRGDLLVRFDIPSLQADAAARRAEVERARARLKNAQAARARAHDLFERGVAARKEVEDADRELADAEAALPEAEAARYASSALAERAVVRARFDGVVVSRTRNPGDVVEASTTDPVMRVIDPARLEVVASVPLPDVTRIPTATTGRITASPDSPPEELKLVSRPAVVETGTASVPVRMAFTGPTRLPAGAPTQVVIDGDTHRNVVLVPTSAVVREGDDAAVFVVADGKAHRVAVSTGFSDGKRVEIRSGIKAGDMVITQGQNGLPDDAPVKVTAPGQ